MRHKILRGGGATYNVAIVLSVVKFEAGGEFRAAAFGIYHTNEQYLCFMDKFSYGEIK